MYAREDREPRERVGYAPTARKRERLRQISNALALDEPPRLDTIDAHRAAGGPLVTQDERE